MQIKRSAEWDEMTLMWKQWNELLRQILNHIFPQKRKQIDPFTRSFLIIKRQTDFYLFIFFDEFSHFGLDQKPYLIIIFRFLFVTFLFPDLPWREHREWENNVSGVFQQNQQHRGIHGDPSGGFIIHSFYLPLKAASGLCQLLMISFHDAL